jgi:hypothetical protein
MKSRNISGNITINHFHETCEITNYNIAGTQGENTTVDKHHEVHSTEREREYLELVNMITEAVEMDPRKKSICFSMHATEICDRVRRYCNKWDVYLNALQTELYHIWYHIVNDMQKTPSNEKPKRKSFKTQVKDFLEELDELVEEVYADRPYNPTIIRLKDIKDKILKLFRKYDTKKI